MPDSAADSVSKTPRESRQKSRQKRRRAESENPLPSAPSVFGVQSGCYGPLQPIDLPRIDRAARTILQQTGMSEAPDSVIDYVTAAGGTLQADGRLTYSAQLIEDALQGLAKTLVLHGQTPGFAMHLSPGRVHVGSGGAAPLILDWDTDSYRESSLLDLYNAGRLVDYLDNIHFFSRSMVARDMPDLHALDINTAYASLSSTRKHVCTSVALPDHAAEVAEMCFTIAGSKQAFMEKPFYSILVNHVVSPLRFDQDSCAVMLKAAQLGLPIHANTFGQMGASSPITMAGCVAQTVAETLSGMIFAWLVNPAANVIFGTRPMITDLRTGAVSGGSGEQATLMAATAQMAQYYGLPNSTIAGATDSKLPDAQSGYEKSLTVSLAAQAGSNMITQACGMQAMLMGVALESYVIDNDMLGGILRSLNKIEVTDETLALASIDKVVHGEGHFLGQAATLNRMQSDFLYPEVGDRRSIDEWEADGAKTIREVARAKTRDILDNHFPRHISPEVDRQLRSNHDIRLSENLMSKQ